MKRRSRQVSKSTTTVSPIGGLNNFDPISAMPATDALVLRNFFPSSYGVSVRRGFKKHAWGFTGTVKTLMPWRDTSGTSHLFAIDDDGIYDITTSGEVDGTPDVALTVSEMQHTLIANAAGTHLIGFNGTDNGVWYSSSGWVRLTAAVVPLTPTSGEWSGVDPKNLIQCAIHQKRVWAVQKNSMLGWYLPPEQIWGIAKSFDFGGVFNQGGYLQALTTWTHDGGDGMDDYLLAISSAGQIAVYKGLSPESADTWSLVGVYFVGATFTRRCFARYGGDVVFITQYGVLSMAGVLKSADGSVLSSALSRKVQNLFSEVAIEGSYRHGWQLLVYPTANMMMVNVPGLQVSQNAQIVLNTIVGAWSTFSGMAAFCWATDQDFLFFGGAGIVNLAWCGYTDGADEDGDDGEEIIASVQQAFDYFGIPGQLKAYKMVRPTFITNGSFKYSIGINPDFKFDNVETPGAVSQNTYGIWNESKWNDGSVWSGGTLNSKAWSSVTDIGFAASLRMTTRSGVELTWTSTDWLFEKGGVI